VDGVRLDKALLDLAAEQRSCVATWQLRELGAAKIEITRLRRSPMWTPCGPKVLVLAGVPHDELVLTSAAVLTAGPGAVLSHEPSVALWGVPGFKFLPAVTSQRSGRATRPHQMGRVHDLVVIPERWVTRYKGIPVVRPELAAYQICGRANPLRAARIFDNFAARGLLSGRSAQACLDDLAERGRNGTVVYREIIRARGKDYVRPATNLEARVKELAEEAGIKLRRQVNLGDEQFDGRVDFYEDEARVIFEVQSELHHWALCDREADAIRRAALERDGFRFVELWDSDI